MREIKFRAICKKECKHEQRLERGAMYYQQTIIETHFDPNDRSISSRVPVLYFVREKSVLYKGKPFYFKQGFTHVLVDNDWIKMQFTGLKDIKNKEIYEGDVVREECCSPDDPAYGFYGEEYEVRWSKYNAGFDLASSNDNWPKQEDGYSYRSGLNQAAHNLEVIGNIYENEELLKEGVEVKKK